MAVLSFWATWIAGDRWEEILTASDGWYRFYWRHCTVNSANGPFTLMTQPKPSVRPFRWAHQYSLWHAGGKAGITAFWRTVFLLPDLCSPAFTATLWFHSGLLIRTTQQSIKASRFPPFSSDVTTFTPPSAPPRNFIFNRIALCVPSHLAGPNYTFCRFFAYSKPSLRFQSRPPWCITLLWCSSYPIVVKHSVCFSRNLLGHLSHETCNLLPHVHLLQKSHCTVSKAYFLSLSRDISEHLYTGNISDGTFRYSFCASYQCTSI